MATWLFDGQQMTINAICRKYPAWSHKTVKRRLLDGAKCLEDLKRGDEKARASMSEGRKKAQEKWRNFVIK